MPVITLAADSVSLVLNGHAYKDYKPGSIIKITQVNPATSHVNGMRNGVSINRRADADVRDVEITLQRLSDDDIFTNNALRQNVPVVFNGSLKIDFVKDGTGGVESWICENGSLTDQPEFEHNNTEGNADAVYKFRFRSMVRNV